MAKKPRPKKDKDLEWWYIFDLTTETKFYPVQGRRITVPGFEDIPFFVYLQNGVWTFSEGRTGSEIAPGDREQEAINNGCKALFGLGHKETLKRIEAMLAKFGISPKFSAEHNGIEKKGECDDGTTRITESGTPERGGGTA